MASAQELVTPTEASLAADVAAIGKIDAIETILEVICRTTGMGFAAVGRVTPDRWIACAVRDEIAFGLMPGGELAIKTTICDEIRASGRHVVIDHVKANDAFREHHTPLQYGFESYISMPIVLPNGQFFGTLCAIDPKPATLNTPAVVGMFRMFAELIAFHFDAQARMLANESALHDAHETAELRDQFIAILGHDLRNPLASIDAGALALSAMPLPPPAEPVVQLIQRSAARMGALIENVLDFARGRLGGGIPLGPLEAVDLGPAIAHVVAELLMAWPGRHIASDVQLSALVCADRGRIAQLASNLLANALLHGDPHSPVRLYVRSSATQFELSVLNAGAPIAPDTIKKLFRPFTRATSSGDLQGLGLGLYIASQIALAHAGSLSVRSDDTETCFTFRMQTLTE
jgi:signal transduction histidine kinase